MPTALSSSWPGLFLESARWLIVKRQIEEAQSVLRILAERNRPHGQMLGEEAQEALQGTSLECLQVVPQGYTHTHTQWHSCHVGAVLPAARVPPLRREEPGCAPVSSNRQLLSVSLKDLENTCPLPATSSFSLASLLNYRNIWKNLLILGFTK